MFDVILRGQTDKTKGLNDMENLTNEQKEIILNLLLQEQRNIHNMNGNIQPLLENYKKELGNIYQKVCNSLED